MNDVLIVGDRVIFFAHVTRIKIDNFSRSRAVFVHFSDGEQWEFMEDEADAVRKYIGDHVISSGRAKRKTPASEPVRA